MAQIHIQTSKDLKQQVQIAAIQQGKSVSEIGRELYLKFLNNPEILAS